MEQFEIRQRELAHRWAAEQIEVKLSEDIADYLEAHGIENPLERSFAYWWYCIRHFKQPIVQDYSELRPQLKITVGHKTYYADFVLTETAYTDTSAYIKRVESLGCPYPKVIIELDGHEFHERTKEQVMSRDQRDRDLQSAGYKVFHLSGAAVYRDAEALISELFSHCEGLLVDWWLSIRRAEGEVDGADTHD